MAQETYAIRDGAHGDNGRDGRVKVRFPSTDPGLTGVNGKNGRAGRVGLPGNNGQPAIAVNGALPGLPAQNGIVGKQGRKGLSYAKIPAFTTPTFIKMPVGTTGRINYKLMDDNGEAYASVIRPSAPTTAIANTGVYMYNYEFTNAFEAGLSINGVVSTVARSTAPFRITPTNPVLVGLLFNPTVNINIPGVTITSGSVAFLFLLGTSASITFTSGGVSYTAYINPGILGLSLSTGVQSVVYNADGSATITFNQVLLAVGMFTNTNIDYVPYNGDLSGVIRLNAGDTFQVYTLGATTGTVPALNRGSIELVSTL